jgi:hypothetical protein
MPGGVAGDRRGYARRPYADYLPSPLAKDNHAYGFEQNIEIQQNRH